MVYALAMPSTPTPSERDWLIDHLAELIRACGHERFMSAPIIDASPRCFPDPWRADPAGVQVVARRLLWHAGFPDRRARVRDLRGFEKPTDSRKLTVTEAC